MVDGVLLWLIGVFVIHNSPLFWQSLISCLYDVCYARVVQDWAFDVDVEMGLGALGALWHADMTDDIASVDDFARDTVGIFVGEVTIPVGCAVVASEADLGAFFDPVGSDLVAVMFIVADGAVGDGEDWGADGIAIHGGETIAGTIAAVLLHHNAKVGRGIVVMIPAGGLREDAAAGAEIGVSEEIALCSATEREDLAVNGHDGEVVAKTVIQLDIAEIGEDGEFARVAVVLAFETVVLFVAIPRILVKPNHVPVSVVVKVHDHGCHVVGNVVDFIHVAATIGEICPTVIVGRGGRRGDIDIIDAFAHVDEGVGSNNGVFFEGVADDHAVNIDAGAEFGTVKHGLVGVHSAFGEVKRR